MTDRARLLIENAEKARRIKEELAELHRAMRSKEDELNALASERSNLEIGVDEEIEEFPTEIAQPMNAKTPYDPKSRWPKVVVGVVALVVVLLGLGGLGIFKNDGSPLAGRSVALSTPRSSPHLERNGNEATVDTLSSIALNQNANSNSEIVGQLPRESPLNILPGVTYTSEITYNMTSSTITLVEVQDTPQITLHLNHAPQSFFIPMKTPFRIDSESNGPNQHNAKLLAFSDRKKHDLEIRFESEKPLPEGRTLSNSAVH
jgi:hypothetical protein